MSMTQEQINALAAELQKAQDELNHAHSVLENEGGPVAPVAPAVSVAPAWKNGTGFGTNHYSDK